MYGEAASPSGKYLSGWLYPVPHILVMSSTLLKSQFSGDIGASGEDERGDKFEQCPHLPAFFSRSQFTPFLPALYTAHRIEHNQGS